MAYSHLGTYVLVAAAAVAALWVVAEDAEATHLLGATMSWRSDSSSTLPADLPTWLPSQDVVIEGRALVTGSYPPGSIVGTGLTLKYGDGASTSPSIRVTTDYGDFSEGEFVDAAGNPLRHTYPRVGMFEVQLTGCCYIGDNTLVGWYHQNNPDANLYMLMTIQLSEGRGPKVDAPLFFQCTKNKNCVVPVEADLLFPTAELRPAIDGEIGHHCSLGRTPPACGMNIPHGDVLFVDPTIASPGAMVWDTSHVSMSSNTSQRTVYSWPLILVQDDPLSSLPAQTAPYLPFVEIKKTCTPVRGNFNDPLNSDLDLCTQDPTCRIQGLPDVGGQPTQCALWRFEPMPDLAS